MGRIGGWLRELTSLFVRFDGPLFVPAHRQCRRCAQIGSRRAAQAPAQRRASGLDAVEHRASLREGRVASWDADTVMNNTVARCSFVLKNPWPGTLSGGERPDTRPSNNNHVQCLGPFTASAKTSQPIIFTDTDHQSCGRHDRMRAFNPDRGLGWRHSRCRRRHRVSGRRASPRVHASSP